jgi:hypothetical protein
VQMLMTPGQAPQVRVGTLVLFMYRQGVKTALRQLARKEVLACWLQGQFSVH